MPYLWALLAITILGCSATDDSPAASGSTDTSATADADGSQEKASDVDEGGDPEACLDCEDATTSEDGILLEEAKGDDEGEGESALVVLLRGSWAQADRQGSMNLRVEEEDGGEVRCELNCEFESASQIESCDGCAFAWEFLLGPVVGAVKDDSCSLLEGICNRTHRYGHSPPDELYVPKAGSWALNETGLSTFEEEVWTFEYTYLSGASSSALEGQESDCFENCIAKGASEEVCAQDCSSGGSGTGKDDTDQDDGSSGKDEDSQSGSGAGCYEACVEKGESEESCAGFCGGGPDDSETDESESSSTGVDQNCYEACVAKGASEEVCTAACTEGAEGSGGGDDGK